MAVAGQPVRIGLIGGGLMGRELAAALARWPILVDHPVAPALTAVADPNPGAREWFQRIASVTTVTDDWRHLIEDPTVDVLYVAVPHDAHEQIAVAAAAAGRDFLCEKPFGIDLPAAGRILAAVERSGGFVRVSSELPYFPGALACWRAAAGGDLGEVIEVRAGFAHSSDLDRGKPINWKRQRSTCGALGVMGDLGMHVAHLPLRLGWTPATVYAIVDDIVTERPAVAGGAELVPCDTWDNALIACRVPSGDRAFPMLWETKRIAPGQLNTWWFEALGMTGGVRFSTRTPTTMGRFEYRDGTQAWLEIQPGLPSAWPVSSGAIFEFGFADALLQMWACYLAERAGCLGGRFGTATPAEALAAHTVFDAALRSGEEGACITLADWPR